MKQRRRKKTERRFTKKMQIKLMALFAFILLVLVGLNIRIAYITSKSGDQYTKQVLSQQQYDSLTIPYRRGEIRDRNNNILARSEKVYNVILDCFAVNSKEAYIEPTVKALSEGLGLEEAEVRSRITAEDTRESQYQVLKKKVSLEDKKSYEDYVSLDEKRSLSKEKRQELQNVQGVWFEEQYIREYPMMSFASNVLGFSNDNNDGVTGLEAYYSDILNGVNGRKYGYLNEELELQRTIIEPKNGNTLISTIDVNIQQIVEKYLAEFEAEHSAGPNEAITGRGSKNLGIVVANPQNGEIYAMGTNRSYDLNDPHNLSDWYTEAQLESMDEKETVEALNERWYNYCVSEAFEPGSTFKPIVVASALESGVLKGDETFVCDGGEFVTDTQINCDNIYGHGLESLSDVIKNSCNDGMMQIGAKMGVKDFLKYQRLFHFGSRTGIDLPNENSGILYEESAMNEVELATNSFGQTFTCTMIQELAAFNAVVNGGYYYQPRVVKQIVDENGGVVKNMDPVLTSQVVSAKSSQTVLAALEQGVLDGTGKKAQVPGYRVGGKTGTAEKIPRGEGRYLVSFIGCAPVDDPQIVVYVVIDEPNVLDQSTGAYPHTISRKIMTEVLPYLNIYPTEEITDEMLYNLGITREEAEAGRTIDATTPETDENGNPIETQETDENGNPVPGQGTEGAVSNPNVPNPPEDNGQNQESNALGNGITNEDLGIE